MRRTILIGLTFALLFSLLSGVNALAEDEEGVPLSLVLNLMGSQGEEEDIEKDKRGFLEKCGFFMDSLRLFGGIQGLATVREKDDWYGPDEIPNEKSGFRIHRARFGIKGKLIEGKLFESVSYSFGYYLQAASGREADPTDDLDAEIIDAYGWVRFDLGEKVALLDPVTLSVGAGKLDFNRAQMTSSRRLNFILRPWLAEALAPERDVGVSMDGGFKEGFVNYSFGVYNGRAESNESIFQGDDNDKVMFVGRVEVNPLGEPCCYFDDDLKVSIGGGFFYNEPLEAKVLGYTVDAYARWWRLSLEGGYINVTIEPDLVGQEIPGVLEEVEKDGFYVQAGFFVWPERVEVVGRYETFDDNLQPEYTEDIHYITGGVNWYFKGSHLHKLQLCYIFRNEDGWGTDDVGEIDNDAFMAQLQLAF